MKGQLTKIGDVAVIDGEPREGNPYKGPQVYAEARREALRLYRDGGDTGSLTFWHAPVSGGARRINDPSEIDWRGMGES